ncbi:hypothetical protein ACIBTV_27725 [Micromonospora sp. NPDC049366]|uniref:hypothetical protein n=1 Tax=Micromonospora sp. NPDC049366 TaxID=3364271 RepID=UPI003799F491
MSGGDVRRLPDYQMSTLDQRAAMIEWARQNGLDPARIIADSIVVDDAARVIRYQEYVDEGAPGAWQPGQNSARRRPASAPLLVDPPPAVFGEPAPRYAPPASYDWGRYDRTCAPDRQLDGLGDLALFLGGSENSFTGDLLKLLAKAQSTPERLRPLAFAFPREATAWLVWQRTQPIPLAAELCGALIENDDKGRTLDSLVAEVVPAWESQR